jgi:hypothetical protein
MQTTSLQTSAHRALYKPNSNPLKSNQMKFGATVSTFFDSRDHQPGNTQLRYMLGVNTALQEQKKAIGEIPDAVDPFQVTFNV